MSQTGGLRELMFVFCSPQSYTDFREQMVHRDQARRFQRGTVLIEPRETA